MQRDPRHFIRRRGGAAVEFLFCLPLLLVLLLPVADIARVIQANMILTSLSREGANLASRTSMQAGDIMDVLASTAQPLDMRAHGMIRVTRILASRQNGVVRNVVIAQHRWNGGSYLPANGVWTCGSAGTYWDADGNCAGFPALPAAPETHLMSGQLDDGEVAHLVEVFYRFPLLFGSLDPGFGSVAFPELNPDLYASTIF